jgi:hypothetical protein
MLGPSLEVYLQGLYDKEAKRYQGAARRYPCQVYCRREREEVAMVETSPEGGPASTGLVDARTLG